MKTTYQGYYIDVRDGKRVGITYTYQMKDHGTMINEKEINIKEL
jgi:hypothetical protein